MIYSKKLILDYITGNEIFNYNIEDLENDPNFMMEVIRYTKDKNMFNLCSDELKENYEFICFVIETFKQDKDFIIKVANEYKEKMPDDDFTKEEITLYMCELLGREIIDKQYVIQYHIDKEIFYNKVKIEIDRIIEEEQEPKLKEKLGLGFLFINDIYKESIIIQNFFAKKIVEKIFYSEEKTLEEIVHQRFKEKESLEQLGIKQYILNTIRMYDNNLFIYVSCHLELIEELELEIKKILKNWENYLQRINHRRIQILEQEVEKYYQENHILVSYEECMSYVIKKRHLENIFKQYEIYDLEDGTSLDLQDLETLKFLHYIDEKIKKLWKNDIINSNIEIIDENTTSTKNQKAKVIKLNRKEI